VIGLKSIGRLAVLPILLLAMLLQADAVVRSLVMQAAPGDLAPICTAHPASMAMPAAGPHTELAGHAAHNGRCPFCEVAAHVPVFGAAAPIPVATTVAFITFESMEARIPAALHAILARARGPPIPA
jgi:hypothetical protein